MRQMIYPAPRVPVGEPPAGFEEVRVPLAGGSFVHGWHRPSPSADLALLFFHGNGENLETLRYGGALDDLASLGGHLLAVDYPGYGRSPGVPSEKTIAAAADAALSWLEERYPDSRPVVVGWSLGAAVAIRLAADHPAAIHGAALVSPWTDLGSVAKLHFPGLLVDFLLREKYDSLAVAARLDCPALVVHGAADTIIPSIQGRRLAEAIGERARWVEVPGYGHNDLLSAAVVWDELRRFLASAGG